MEEMMQFIRATKTKYDAFLDKFYEEHKGVRCKHLLYVYVFVCGLFARVLC